MELTWYHFYPILLVKAGLKLKNEETVPILRGTSVYSNQAEKSSNGVNERGLQKAELELKNKEGLIPQSRGLHSSREGGRRACMDGWEEFTGFCTRGPGRQLWGKTQQKNIFTPGTVPQCTGRPGKLPVPTIGSGDAEDLAQVSAGVQQENASLQRLGR